MKKPQRTILLIEDSPEDRLFVRRALAADGDYRYEVRETSTGAEGLALWREQTPDCVLLDYQLPDTDGLALLATLNPDPLHPASPVIMMTGGGDEALAVTALKSGAQDYLSKARITPELLRHTINRAIDGVTAQRQLAVQQQQLAESEERYNLAFAAVQALIYDWNIVHDTIRRSAELKHLLGFDNDEPGIAYNKWWLTRLHPDEAERATQLIKDAIKSGAERFEDEYRMQHKDGHYVWVRDSGVFLKNADGKVVRCVGSVRNIEERKQAEANLRASEERATLGVQVSDFVICEIDYATDTNHLSPEAARLYGLGTDEMTVSRATVHATFHPDEADELARLIAEALNPHGDGWFACEHRVVKPNGEVRWLNIRKQIFFNRAATPPHPLRAILAARDITERKRHELNLAFLAEISQDLLGITVDTVMQTVGAKMGAYLQLSACTLMEINEAADEAMVTHEWHRADRPSLAGKYHISDFVRDDFHRASRAGETFIVRDTAADPRTNADDYAALQVGSYVSVPLIRNNEWQFLLVLFDDKARHWRNDEIELMQELMTRIWIRLERARTQESLRESEARLNAILQNMNSVIYLLDAENRFVHVNRLWEELLNLKADEVRGKSVYDVFPAAIADKFAANNRRVMDTGKTIVFEETAPLADGEHIYHSVKVPRLDVDGKAYGIVGISTDITERKLVEATLYASEVRYRRLFETTQDGILILNIETARITNANPYISELLGFSHAELLGKELWQIGLFKDIEESKAAVRELQANDYIRYEDLPLETKAGQRADVEFVSNVYQENGHSVIQCNIRDITERKRAEAERERLLAEAQRLRELAETANRIKDEFLATISHELRTPLNHMLGWVVLLRGGQLAPEKAAEALATIERNVRAQNRLVEDLLDVSRIVTGKMQLLVQPVVLAQVVEAAVASARPAAEAKNIRLQVVLDSRASTVSGDPDRLQQIVWNLISNAIKFTPKDGRVQVRLDRVHSHVEVTVSDTGEGLAPEFLPYVFDRFSQGDGSLKRKHGGLGLGLAIVRQLVELQGGEVFVTSPGLGQGATFTVTLPLRIMKSGLPNEAATVITAQAEQPVNHDPLSALLKGVRVLVVDDEADSRLLLIAMLAGSEVEVRTAGSMDEALETLADWRPDVLLSDIGMPNGDGYDLIREIRQRDAATGQWLPAVALTAYARSEDRLRAIKAGFQMHVAKPVEPQELLMVIASLTGRLVTEMNA